MLTKLQIEKFDITLLFQVYHDVAKRYVGLDFMDAFKDLKNIRNEIKHFSQPQLDLRQAEEYEQRIKQVIQNLQLTDTQKKSIESIQEDSESKESYKNFCDYFSEKKTQKSTHEMVEIYMKQWKKQMKLCMDLETKIKVNEKNQDEKNQEMSFSIQSLEQQVESLSTLNRVQIQRGFKEQQQRLNNEQKLEILIKKVQKFDEYIKQQNIKQEKMQTEIFNLIDENENLKSLLTNIDLKYNKEEIENNFSDSEDVLIQELQKDDDQSKQQNKKQKLYQLSLYHLHQYKKNKNPDDFQQAEYFAKQSVKKQPNDYRSYLMLGNCYYLVNNKIKALQYFEKTLELYPELEPIKQRIKNLKIILNKDQLIIKLLHLKKRIKNK